MGSTSGATNWIAWSNLRPHWPGTYDIYRLQLARSCAGHAPRYQNHRDGASRLFCTAIPFDRKHATAADINSQSASEIQVMGLINSASPCQQHSRVPSPL